MIDELLARQSYGEQFASVWRERLAPPEMGSKKQGRDSFSPWLAAQFNESRAWSQIVTNLLTVEGRVRDQPQSAFIMANSDNFDPQPNLLADATSRLFWGVQLRCAECHDHPFAPWKQDDFWGTAAFFSRVRRGYALGKNPVGWTITEAPPDEPISRKFGKSMAAKGVPGPAIIVSVDGAKLEGRTVKGKFLGGSVAAWSDKGPFRTRFAKWATGKDHPYFAANTVNRWWAHFFGRGLVNPLDGFQPGNTPSHPDVLKLLVTELATTDFDLKHLIRVICNTRAYQRTSRPTKGNELDESLLSHMAVKPLRPEMLYNALSIALFQPQKKPGVGKTSFTPPVQPLPGISRPEFVRFFRSRDDEREGSQVNNGIPQLLRLMNGPLLNDRARILDQFAKRRLTSSEMINALMLAAYSRHPTNSERKMVTEFMAQYSDEKQAWSAVLWALLNSSEFTLNH
ncbi:MAG: DUF1553 domain-containing protein [Planctomycetes bacterium]|nr:DUF1553 domain-containing protein [Planctomycetota bacterium]